MKIHTLLIAITLFFVNSVNAQRKITATDSFRIFGKVKQEKTFSLAELDSFPKQQLPDQIVYNHKGEIKDTLTGMKGVLLSKVLESTAFVYDKPKALNEFYFVCTASDGYKVVFSWNEIYNTEIGNHLFIITERKGKKLAAIEERVMLLSAADLKAGRRYIKALDRIEVKQTE